MTVKTSSFYPTKRFSINDLIDPVYQSTVNTDMLNMMKKKELRVINKYFQELLMTRMNKYALRRMPIMDPKVMLDTIVPECTLESQSNFVYRVRSILTKLIPISEQMVELKAELKDAIKIAARQELLMELGKKISRIQASVMKLMKKIRETPAQPRVVVTATMYTVLKASETVFAFRETVLRAVNLHLVMKPAVFFRMIQFIDQQQMAVYKMCMVAISPMPAMDTAAGVKATPMASQDAPAINPMAGMSRIYRYNYDQTPPAAPVDETVQTPPAMDIAGLMKALQILAAKQVEGIHHVWNCVINSAPMDHSMIHWLIENTAGSIMKINQQIQAKNLQTNVELMQLIYQAAVQHQILVDALVMARFGDNAAVDHASVDNVQRYAFKVQTAELLERGMVLHHQHKMDMVCGQGLTAMEKQVMEKLMMMDRQLVALQHHHVHVPAHVMPWIPDVATICNVACTTMTPMLAQCASAVELLMKMPAVPHPCLAVKLVETVITLQQKIAVFRKTLTAQWFSDQVRPPTLTLRCLFRLSGFPIRSDLLP